ncbi:MAG: lipoprotein [Gammaproteobacteria bacterium]|nr:lipoprotein [Gammaproteobacteria bacterium]
MSLHRQIFITLMLALCASIVTGACGRKGDLYLPDTDPNAKTNVKPNPPPAKQP